MPQLPVTVVTGFLGAGKTTLLERWLRSYAPGEVTVIVNEVATVGIDAERLEAHARRVVEITGGCVCCATFAELVKALEDIAAPGCRRVVVETSGAASPAGVLRAVQRQDALALDGVVTVVDGTRAEALLARSDLAREQVGFADVVVISRADRLDEGARDAARDAVATASQAARVTFSSRGETDAPLDALLAAAPPLERAAPAHDASDHPIASVSLTHDGELDEARFGEWMESDVAAVGGRLYRIKAILAMEGIDARVHLEGVADEVEVTLGAPWADAPRRSRMVLVGFGLDADALDGGFRACAAR